MAMTDKEFHDYLGTIWNWANKGRKDLEDVLTEVVYAGFSNEEVGEIVKAIVYGDFNTCFNYDNNVIYYEAFSRDCDMCESHSYNKFEGTSEQFDKMVEKSYEGAEGEMWFKEITKEEYDAIDSDDMSSTRDRVMEAYENGNGNSGIV